MVCLFKRKDILTVINTRNLFGRLTSYLIKSKIKRIVHIYIIKGQIIFIFNDCIILAQFANLHTVITNIFKSYLRSSNCIKKGPNIDTTMCTLSNYLNLGYCKGVIK